MNIRWTLPALLCAQMMMALGVAREVRAYQPDIMVRGAGETLYRGENICYTTRLNQTKIQMVSTGAAAVYELRIRNSGPAADAIRLTGTPGDSGWAVSYFDALSVGTDITAHVTGDGWVCGPLDSGASAALRVEVTPGLTAMNKTEKRVHVFAVSQSDSTKSDMVKARTRVSVGQVYYVSTSGSDSNPGTFEHPWATPGYASRRLQPGDTLYILGGKYVIRRFDDDIMAPPSGTPEARITIVGQQGNRPVIAGRDNLFAAMFLGGRSHVTIRNLEITHDTAAIGPEMCFRGGVDIGGGPASHIVLQDLYIHHIDEIGINMQDVDDIKIINCRIEYCGFGAIGGPAGEEGGCGNVLIRGCELSYGGHYYRGGDGSDRPYDRPDGYGIEPSNGPIEIADTVAQHNYGDGLDSKSANTYIHNCIAANNSCDGIKLWADNGRIVNCLVCGTGDGIGGGSPWAGIVLDDVDHPNASFLIENVTVHDNPTRHAYPMYVQYGCTNPINLVMRNCIISNGYGMVYIGNSVNFTCEYNLFYRPGDPEQVFANGRTYTAAQLGQLGPGNVSASPLFVGPAWGTTGDYHLLPGSPGVDAGTPVGAPAVDLEYRGRPQSAGYDMGAYER